MGIVHVVHAQAPYRFHAVLVAEVQLNLEGIAPVLFHQLQRNLLAVETAELGVMGKGQTGHGAGEPVAVYLGADQGCAAGIEKILSQISGRAHHQGLRYIVLELYTGTGFQGVVAIVVVDDPAPPPSSFLSFSVH